MRIRKYNGKDMQEALAKVRADLGVEAVILNSRKVKRRGVAAWFSKPYFEVLAAVDENYAPTERVRRPAQVPARKAEWQENRYEERPAVPSGERVSMPDRKQELNPDRSGAAYPRERQTGGVLPLRTSGPERNDRIQTEETVSPRAPARYGAAAYAGNTAASLRRETAGEERVPSEEEAGPDKAGIRRDRSSGERAPAAEKVRESGTELGALREQVESMAKMLERMQERIPDIRPFPGNPAPPAVQESVETAAAEPAVAESVVEKKETSKPDKSVQALSGGISARIGQERAPDRFLDMQHRLRDQEVDDALAERIMDKVRDMLPANAGDEEIRRQTSRVLTAALGEPETIRLRTDGKPLVAAFIGPTGVGKTTTLAKIAADYALNRGKKVGLITADTYRIAAVEQLKTYAEILNLPVTVVYAPSDLQEAVAAHQDKDIILIDTAGRSHRNRQQFDELQQLMQAVKMDEVYLVLSGNTGRAACREILEHYTFVRDYKLLFTKLDETPVPGVIFNARLRTGRPISYITTGQSVPDDLEVADPKALAAGLAGIAASAGTTVNGRKAP